MNVILFGRTYLPLGIYSNDWCSMLLKRTGPRQICSSPDMLAQPADKSAFA